MMSAPRMTVLSVIGTRPEAIKMAPVIHALSKLDGAMRSVVCVTGQHRELLDQAMTLFGLTADIDLHLMQPGQSLTQLTARLFNELGPVVERVRPDWVLAQGDTTTVLVAAMVAFYQRVRFGHVEAGLRTGRMDSPFPEEMNRRTADSLSTLMFAPTERSRQTLLAEGHAEADVVLTGNTAIDALLTVADQPYDWASGPLAALPADRRLVLVTAHRRESFGEPLREVCRALRDLATRFEGDGVHLVYPVHPNPNVRGPVEEALSGLPGISLLPPLDYGSLVHLMKRSALVLTDSGGIQEEAPSFRVPVLVLRDTTERPEGVEAGVARLVGTEHGRIVTEASELLRNPQARQAMVTDVNPYGDGKAASRIVSALMERG